MLTDHLPHGDGLVAHGFIKRLADRGHSLFVAAEEVCLRYPLPDSVEVFPIRRRFRAGGVGRLEYMWEVRKLYQRLQRAIDFDVIHQLNPVYTGITLALSPVNKPVVLGPYVADWPVDPNAMGNRKHPLVRSLLRKVKKSAARAQQRTATSLLVTTEETLSRVVEDHQRETMTHLLPHGIDSDFFSPVASHRGLPLVILFLANISERKGIFDLLKAFDQVALRFPEVMLWVAGSGEHEHSARTVAATLNSAERILFLGRQTREQALALYRDADIYCMPSHGEPFGMTVLEAMSCGLPVVVTNAGGVRWIVDDNGAIRVPDRSPLELAAALGELIEAPGRRERMGAHNRAKVLQQFTWDRVIDRLEQIYLSAISRFAERRAPRVEGRDERLAKEVRAYD